MATQNKIIEMIGAIKTIYSYYAKDTDVKLLVNTWTMLLKPYDDEAVGMAFYKCLQTCKMPPTPADVIENINAMVKTLEPSDEELWAIYSRDIRKVADQVTRFNYTYVDESGISQGQQARNKVEEIFNALPDKIKRYVASKGELIRIAMDSMHDADFMSWEKQRFMKSMPIMQKRQEYSALMLEGGKSPFLIGGAE